MENLKTQSFFIDCIPPKTTAQQHKKIRVVKGGFAQMYIDSIGRAVEHDYLCLLHKHKADTWTEPIRVDITIIYPFLASDSKKKRALHFIPHPKRPDRDNIVKLLFDCMTKLRFWEDDSQICDGKILKVRGERPGIFIRINPCPESYTEDDILCIS